MTSWAPRTSDLQKNFLKRLVIQAKPDALSWRWMPQVCACAPISNRFRLGSFDRLSEQTTLRSAKSLALGRRDQGIIVQISLPETEGTELNPVMPTGSDP